MIFNIPIEEYIDRLIKQAEFIYGRNAVVSKLLDKAFEKVGQYADGFYAFQDQSLAMLRMLKAWYAREYTGLSKRAVVGLIASAIYIANPLDFIPDFIPFIGRLDDSLVLGYFTKQLNVEIQRFMAWEVEQGFV
jgi:uncharacterized membrane protein YkvA (DUF1232 family)